MSHAAIDDALLADFCKHLSSGINVVDLLDKLEHLKPDYELSKDDPLLLRTNDPEVFERLKEFKYDELVRACVTSLRIEPSCYDVFLSEIEKDTFAWFVWGFENLTLTVKVEVDERGFVIHTPAFLSDIILPLISRFHHNVLIALDHFQALIKASENNPNAFYVHSKSPTPESQFIDIWVATRLRIPLLPEASVASVGNQPPEWL